MNRAKVWVEKTVIPTYEVGEAEKNPMFLDKRVYQGSSGKVYPYPTIDRIADQKTDREYTAVYLENEYLKVMVLPQLGGRIQRAYDKTNQYDFVYYNHVIKPALVGLTGPWISGGIEFNWPQHHRPTTFSPVDFCLEERQDGSASVLLHDVDQMYGTRGIAQITLYPGKAYIEIRGQLYNRTSLPQTFLWWANPAVPVNDHTQTVFPPDVHAVMDHGKRDVSRFPIATGVYYKKDYSEGVDISRYKNIPVPTSYMAEKSSYDFVGGYDYEKRAGILHVADHHISPGKKQWTWGCGDFGRAWDRNLTDEDGPYVELMTGVYTDNQPDFTWLKPFEEKTFTQYFMPYKEVGRVKNATVDAAVNLTCEGGNVSVTVYATGVFEHAKVVLTEDGAPILEEETRLSPVDIYHASLSAPGKREQAFCVSVWDGERCLVRYQPEEETIPKMPEPAKAAKDPEQIMTNEELYLTGQHIEQYRHATYLPDPYYLEGLKRDPGDIRINNAYGQLLMRRGQLRKAEACFRKALERLTERNPNPYHSESYYLLGLVLFYQNRFPESYDAFYKATWSNEQQEMSYYYLAAIDARNEEWEKALEHVERALVKNAHNVKARGLKMVILRKLGQTETAVRFARENLELDPFDYISGNELVLLEPKNGENQALLDAKTRGFRENVLMMARDYAEFGCYTEAAALLEADREPYPLLRYYEAYYKSRLGEEAEGLLQAAEDCPSDYCFPNKLEDMEVLAFAVQSGIGVMAAYYLGNLYYDKLQWKAAVSLWEMTAKEKPAFPTVHRNLALAYYNRAGKKELARQEMELAFQADESDARIFMELDQLYKKLGMSVAERLEHCEAHMGLTEQRDDMYIEYITLLNMSGKHEEAYRCIMGRRFKPWEGGEGKITAQYTLALFQLAKQARKEGRLSEAEELLRKALVFPENLGEGRLEGTKDNHLYYLLGLVLEEQDRQEEAKQCFTQATLGTDEPAGVMFYNDQPADMILYQGLSWQKLGRTAQAKSRFYRLIDYGERHLQDEVRVDYFAVSLPDFLVFEEDYTLKNYVHCNYLMGLGNIGLGNTEKAEAFLEEAIRKEPGHVMANIYARGLEDF